MLSKKLQDKLNERIAGDSLRKLEYNDDLIDFCSNDYLGLAASSSFHQEIQTFLSQENLLKNGSGGSRLLAGHNRLFEKTEKFLAELFHAEKFLLFNSGYNANLSILSAIPQKGDTILYDELIHTSLKDGARLSFADRYAFRHNDLEDLEQKITKAKGDVYVVTESVFSMDGDFAPLKEMTALCKKLNVHLIVDEAHSTGIWGNQGEGLLVQQGLEKDVFARIYTFGKGMGVHGAGIAGTSVLIDYLINFARPFIYTTALSYHSVAAILCAFTYLEKHPELRSALLSNIDYFNQLKKSTIQRQNKNIESSSAIQVIIVPGNEQVKALATKIRQTGFDVRPILSPTVKKGEERLRICLHYFNTQDQIKKLVDIISETQL